MKRLTAKRSGRRGTLLFIAAVSLCCAAAVRAEPPVSTEYKVKTGLIFNFTQFVDWPAASFENATAPIEIGVLGDNPFGSALEDAVRGQTVHGRPLVVRPATHRIADLKGCHVVFVCRSEKMRLRDVLDGLKGSGALTIGDTEDFAANGGMINFVLKDGKIRFEINNAAAKRENIRISSQLLDLGKPVEEKEHK